MIVGDSSITQYESYGYSNLILSLTIGRPLCQHRTITRHAYVSHGKWPMTDRYNAHRVEGNHFQKLKWKLNAKLSQPWHITVNWDYSGYKHTILGSFQRCHACLQDSPGWVATSCVIIWFLKVQMDTLFDHSHAQRQIDRTTVSIAPLLGDRDIFPPLLLTQECMAG